MTSRPMVTATELAVTINRIHHRHANLDDPDREHLTDEPRDIRAYLRKHAHRRFPTWARRADLTDLMTLDNAIWWGDRMDLLADLLRGRELGMRLIDLGAPLGITTAQGTLDLIDRLTALKRYHRPDEKLTRAERRIPTTATVPSDPRHTWLARHHDRLIEAATGLLAVADRYPVTDQDWLDELRADLTDNSWTPGSIGVLGLACGDVRTAPAIAALNRPPAVFARIDQLRASWAAIT